MDEKQRSASFHSTPTLWWISVSQDLLLTAIHSLRSSPSGSITACLRLPLPRVASACFRSSYWWEPSGIFFLGLNVFEDRLPLRKQREMLLMSPSTAIPFQKHLPPTTALPTDCSLPLARSSCGDTRPFFLHHQGEQILRVSQCVSGSHVQAALFKSQWAFGARAQRQTSDDCVQSHCGQANITPPRSKTPGWMGRLNRAKAHCIGNNLLRIAA